MADKKKIDDVSGPVEKVAKSGKELAGQAVEVHRKVAYAGLSLTSKMRGKGDGLFDSIIDVAESVQVSALEIIDKNSEDIGKSIDKIAKAIDECIDSVEGEVSENIKESGVPLVNKPLKENANIVASIVEEVQESVTGFTKTLLDDEDEESKNWKDDDLADW